MKIALLTDGISPYVVGGMQTHSAVIANQLVKANNEVDLFHFVTKNSPIPTANEVNDIFFSKTQYKFNNIYCCRFPNTIKFWEMISKIKDISIKKKLNFYIYTVIGLSFLCLLKLKTPQTFIYIQF